MANFFRKSDIKKKQVQKRMERQQRREARKKRGPASFEDMIAYVDEYGRITDTPPNPAEREEVKLEDIEVAIPTDEEIAEELALDGRVKFYNPDKGFGFIKAKEHNDQFFFHISNAPEDIAENDRVTFQLENSPRGLNAVEVEYV